MTTEFALGGDMTVRRMGYGAIRITEPGIWGPAKDKPQARRVLRRAARSCQVLNVLGARLACYASVLIDFLRFIVLEGTWCAVALIALVRACLRPDHTVGGLMLSMSGRACRLV